MKAIFISLKDKFFSPNCRKKNIENLVIFLVGIVIIIIAWGYFFDDSDKETALIDATLVDSFNVEDFEIRLAKILSKIKNAGNVDVMISYQTGIETIPLLDTKDNRTITEENNAGSVRKTEQNSAETSIIFNQEKSGNKVPYISKKIMPKVEGVIVTCDGGGDATVKSNIVKAVQAVTGIDAGKIQVFPREGKR